MASHRDDRHFLSECRYLPERDRKYIFRARSITDMIKEEEMEEEYEEEEDGETDESVPSSACQVQVRESPYVDMFCNHHTLRLVLDSGATENRMSEATVLKLGAIVAGPSQRVNQADGKSPLQVKGGTRLVFQRGDWKYHFEGLVIGNLNVEVLAGTPFMEQSDIALRPAQEERVFSEGHKCKNDQKPVSSTHTIFRAHVLRAPQAKVS